MRPFAVAMLAACAAAVLYGAGTRTHWALVSRLTGARAIDTADAGRTGQLILTLGLSLVLQNGGLMLLGSSPVSIPNDAAIRSWMLKLAGGDVMVFINQTRALSAVTTLAAVALTVLLLSRTGIGRQLRAVASNPIAALDMGVNVDHAFRTVFGTGLALTAVAGICVATFYPFQAHTGFDFVIIMYAGVVLGGMGSVGGAFSGGLLIGLVQQLATLVRSPQLQNTAVFVVVLAALLVRPQGLFGRGVERA